MFYTNFIAYKDGVSVEANVEIISNGDSTVHQIGRGGKRIDLSEDGDIKIYIHRGRLVLSDRSYDFMKRFAGDSFRIEV